MVASHFVWLTPNSVSRHHFQGEFHHDYKFRPNKSSLAHATNRGCSRCCNGRFWTGVAGANGGCVGKYAGVCLPSASRRLLIKHMVVTSQRSKKDYAAND